MPIFSPFSVQPIWEESTLLDQVVLSHCSSAALMVRKGKHQVRQVLSTEELSLRTVVLDVDGGNDNLRSIS